MLDTSFKIKVPQFSRRYPRDGDSDLVVIDSDGNFTDVDGPSTGTGTVIIRFYSEYGNLVGEEITNQLDPYAYAFNLNGVFKGTDFLVGSTISGLLSGVTAVSANLRIISEQYFSRQDEDLFVYNVIDQTDKFLWMNKPFVYRILYRSTLVPFTPNDILFYDGSSNILSTATYQLTVTLSDGKRLLSNIIDSTEVVQSGCCW